MNRFYKYLILSISFFLIIVFLIFFISIDYKMYDLKAKQENYSIKISEIDTDSLSEALISRMTLKEKIGQMYGEKMIYSVQKFIGNYELKNRFAHIYAGRNDRLNIPPWVLSDGPRGARVLD